MKQTTTREKIRAGRPLTDSKPVMLLRDALRPVLSLIARTRIPYKVVIEQPCRLLEGRPVIYAVNHFCFADTPILCRIVPKRGYILLGKQRLGFSDFLYFILNGVIFVDRKDKADMAASKNAMQAYLHKGRSVIVFPEGTWNLTENQLMMPMKYGIIEMAEEAGAKIVPVVLEYDREHKRCQVFFGEPMIFAQEESKLAAIEKLRDTMAFMRWEFWEQKGIFRRAGLDMDAERQKLFYSISEYPTIDWEYESSCIFNQHTEPKDALSYPDKMLLCRENAFLLRRNL